MLYINKSLQYFANASHEFMMIIFAKIFVQKTLLIIWKIGKKSAQKDTLYLELVSNTAHYVTMVCCEHFFLAQTIFET